MSRVHNERGGVDAGTALCLGVALGLHPVSGSPRDISP